MKDSARRRHQQPGLLHEFGDAGQHNRLPRLTQPQEDGPARDLRDLVTSVMDTTEYLSDRTAHLSANIAEDVKAGASLGAVARQIRSLSSNTSLEASRMGSNASVAEIARQMRLLSQQVTALSEHLNASLRSQTVVLDELVSAVDGVLADTAAMRAHVERDVRGPSPARGLDHRGLLESIPAAAVRAEDNLYG